MYNELVLITYWDTFIKIMVLKNILIEESWSQMTAYYIIHIYDSIYMKYPVQANTETQHRLEVVQNQVVWGSGGMLGVIAKDFADFFLR